MKDKPMNPKLAVAIAGASFALTLVLAVIVLQFCVPLFLKFYMISENYPKIAVGILMTLSVIILINKSGIFDNEIS